MAPLLICSMQTKTPIFIRAPTPTGKILLGSVARLRTLLRRDNVCMSCDQQRPVNRAVLVSGPNCQHRRVHHHDGVGTVSRSNLPLVAPHLLCNTAGTGRVAARWKWSRAWGCSSWRRCCCDCSAGHGTAKPCVGNNNSDVELNGVVLPLLDLLVGGGTIQSWDRTWMCGVAMAGGGTALTRDRPLCRP